MQKIHQSRCHYQLYEKLIKNLLTCRCARAQTHQNQRWEKERANDFFPVRLERPAHNNDNVFN